MSQNPEKILKPSDETHPTKGSAKRASRIPKTHASVELIASIIHGHHVDRAGQETRLEATQENAAHEQTCEALRYSFTDCDDA